MHDNHGLRTGGDCLCDLVGIYAIGVDIRFDQHGRAAIRANGQNGGDERVCRHDDLVAGSEAVRTDYQPKGIETVRHAQCVLATAIVGEPALKPLAFVSQNIPAAIQHPLDATVDFVTEPFVYLVKIQKLDRLGVCGSITWQSGLQSFDAIIRDERNRSRGVAMQVNARCGLYQREDIAKTILLVDCLAALPGNILPQPVVFQYALALLSSFVFVRERWNRHIREIPLKI